MPIPIPSGLDRHVRFLWGVGPERSTQLARLAIHTVFDLLLHRPLRYEDRRQVLPIRALELGKASSARGRIVALGVKRYRQKTRSIFEFVLDDGTARLHCRWWNLPYLEDYYAQGDEVLVHGKVLSLRPRTIDHPETEIIDGGEESSIHLNRIAPIYPLTEGLPQRWLRALIWRTLQECDSMIGEPWPDLAAEISRALSSPPQIKSNFDLLSRREAIRFLHFPNELGEADRARQRLAFEEFLDLQLAIQTRRKNFLAKARSRPCPGNNQWIKPFLAGLGFALTPAQTRVLRDMRADLSRGRPMRRLLQGEVGSGKTVVAACTALMVLESGFNVVLMAPTEILAEQHYRNFRKWFEPLGIAVGICTGSFKTVSRNHSKSSAPTPVQTHPSLVIGTHALIEEAFAIADLGLVIIDEQHKFGVAQREQLVRKGEFPHLLVMTATPIPRTLGLTLYGDLDLSVIDELPPDRGRVKTFIRAPDKLPKVWAFVREKIAAGRQAYVVYPRVEETDAGEIKAAAREFERLQRELKPARVGLVHGRLSAQEKETVMNDFRAGKIQVLLSTAVIEVGVDVPNATVMIVENAERFGLAQLHQLRGRIGRGAHESYCVLVVGAKSAEARERLRILEETNDGFRIAEEDLQRRGTGDFLGKDQSGLPPMRFGDLTADRDLVELARAVAKQRLGQSAVTNDVLPAQSKTTRPNF